MAITYRDTQYELYTIGAVDPQRKHVWGFSSASERETFLNKHLSKTINGCIYWKVDDTIKIDASSETGFSYENSYYYDYVRITNRPGTAKEFKWYCFIVSRKYLNLNCTELTLDVDWVQTFYFNSNASPWWAVQGYGVATTDLSIFPPRGIGSEFPSLARVNLWQYTSNSRSYCFVVYSTIDITAFYTINDGHITSLSYNHDPNTQPTPRGVVTDGVMLGSLPYIVNIPEGLENEILNILNYDLNAAGQIGAITGIYTILSDYVYLNGSGYAIQPFIDVIGSITPTITIDVPSADSLFTGQNIINPILKGFDYTFISITNQTGEENIYHYEDFVGNPKFYTKICFTSGYPTMAIWPAENYKYGKVNQAKLFIMKQSAPVQGSLNADNYMIWQAQNRNSIQASIDAGKLTVSNAQEAQSKTGGIASMLDSLFEKAGNTVQSMLPNLGLSEEMQNAITTGGYQGLNSLLSYGMLGSFGLEASYVYKQQVKVAQQALKSVEAQFKDKRYLPPSSSGSNAYGDLWFFNQYGFEVSVITTENLTDLDRINESTGHICKGLVTCRKSRNVFDYWRMLEPKISNAPYNRPQFVNALLTTLFNDGVYLWWYNSSTEDIDTQNFSHPYAVTNTTIS